MYITIKSLWERHKNKSLIARLTGHDWRKRISCQETPSPDIRFP